MNLTFVDIIDESVKTPEKLPKFTDESPKHIDI